MEWHCIYVYHTNGWPTIMNISVYEGWNFNFGNTSLDWIQELLQ